MSNDSNGKRRREFEDAALPHLDLLYNSALQMTRNPEDAQDLIQETFVRAYRFFDKFEKGTNCKAWLFKIMRNNFINRYRKRAKEPSRVDFDEIENTISTEEKSESFSQEDVLDTEKIFQNMLEDDVKDALDSLPEEFKMSIILSDIEGFSYQEIADILDCPIGTVRSRISRGRKLLQKKLYDFAKHRGIVKA